VHYR